MKYSEKFWLHFKKKDYKVELNGLSFYADDVYSVDKNKKMTI